MSLEAARLDWIANPRIDRNRRYGSDERAVLSLAALEEAEAAVSGWPGYAPTPLRSLPDIAHEIGVREVLYKDESARFDLKSFKALGGAYAVERIARERGTEGLVVTCATDGNHGRSVAWGAQRLGCRAVIFIHEGVSEGRAEAIRAFGAEVRRAGHHYDESVRIAAETAAREGWQIVSDTSWEGYTEVPRHVMQGYALMAAEALRQGAFPTHVFVQGGVGGLAAGILSWYWETLGPDRPILAVVEPEKADCLLRSARAGCPTTAPGDLDTIMAGLACGEPSQIAWPLLDSGADVFLAIPDAAAAEMMRRLSWLGIVGGESGVASLAGLIEAARDPLCRAALSLGPLSSVIVFGTEGDTDPDVYRRIVGRDADEVRRAAAEAGA